MRIYLIYKRRQIGDSDEYISIIQARQTLTYGAYRLKDPEF